MAMDVLDALALEIGDELGMEDELLKRIVNTLIVRLDIDDGAQLRLMEDVVVLGFTTTNADDALRHGEEGVHGGGVAVELVENGIGAFHHLLILIEGH